jgi:putative resolvase
VNLTEWAHAQGIHVTTAYRWYREGALPVPARKVGRLILVSPGTAVGPFPQGGAGLYAQVSSRGQKAGLDRQVARLSAWAAQAGMPVFRVAAEVGSGMNGPGPGRGGCWPTRRPAWSWRSTATGWEG